MQQQVIAWPGGGIPGYGEGRPDRSACSLPSLGKIVLETGELIAPPHGDPAIWLRIQRFGPAIITESQTDARAWLWDGISRPPVWQDIGPIWGPSSVIFDATDKPVIVDTVAKYQATGGYRYVDTAGQLVAFSETYADPARGVWEYTDFGDMVIGQGSPDGVVVRFADDGIQRRLAFEKLTTNANAHNIRVWRDGDAFVITVVDYTAHVTTMTSCTLSELRTLPAVPVPVPMSPVAFRFTHPVLVAPFKDPAGATAATAEIIVNQTGQTVRRGYFVAEDSLDGPFAGERMGIYSEAPDPTSVIAVASGLQTRVLLVHDAPNGWEPTGLRPWDICGLELYLVAGEPSSAAITRWTANLDRLLSAWSGDVAVIPMFYCGGGAPPNEAFALTDVLDGLRALSAIVNRSPRVKVIAPFAYLRANGITGHPPLADAFSALLIAAATAGLATLTPVLTPKPTPKPTPAPMPIPVPTFEGDLFMKTVFTDPASAILPVKRFQQVAGAASGVVTAIKVDDRVHSCQPDGTMQDRDSGADGVYERCRVNGSVLVYSPTSDGTTYYIKPFVIVDGLQ